MPLRKQVNMRSSKFGAAKRFKINQDKKTFLRRASKSRQRRNILSSSKEKYYSRLLDAAYDRLIAEMDFLRNPAGDFFQPTKGEIEESSFLRGSIVGGIARKAETLRDLQVLKDVVRHERVDFIKEIAVRTLGRAKDKTAVPLVMDVLEAEVLKERKKIGGSTNLMLNCARVLFQLGPKQVRPRLRKMLKSSDVLTVKLAELALAPDIKAYKKVILEIKPGLIIETDFDARRKGRRKE